jgi:hypothetical protein
MRPPSLAEVGAAKADGREAAFESLGRSERYAVILPLLKARTPQQRAERLGGSRWPSLRPAGRRPCRATAGDPLPHPVQLVALFPPFLSSSLPRGCRPDRCRDGAERAETRPARRGHPVRGGHRASHRHGPERQAAVAAEAASRTLAEVGRRRRRVTVELRRGSSSAATSWSGTRRSVDRSSPTRIRPCTTIS